MVYGMIIKYTIVPIPLIFSPPPRSRPPARCGLPRDAWRWHRWTFGCVTRNRNKKNASKRPRNVGKMVGFMCFFFWIFGCFQELRWVMTCITIYIVVIEGNFWGYPMQVWGLVSMYRWDSTGFVLKLDISWYIQKLPFNCWGKHGKNVVWNHAIECCLEDALGFLKRVSRHDKHGVELQDFEEEKLDPGPRQVRFFVEHVFVKNNHYLDDDY